MKYSIKRTGSATAGQGRMNDFLENLEDAAQRQWDELQLADGKMKCPSCSQPFDPDKEGRPLTDNPYALPVCGNCLNLFLNAK